MVFWGSAASRLSLQPCFVGSKFRFSTPLSLSFYRVSTVNVVQILLVCFGLFFFLSRIVRSYYSFMVRECEGTPNLRSAETDTKKTSNNRKKSFFLYFFFYKGQRTEAITRICHKFVSPPLGAVWRNAVRVCLCRSLVILDSRYEHEKQAASGNELDPGRDRAPLGQRAEASSFQAPARRDFRCVNR